MQFMHLKLHLCHNALQSQNWSLDIYAQDKQVKNDTDIWQATDITGPCVYLFKIYKSKHNHFLIHRHRESPISAGMENPSKISQKKFLKQVSLKLDTCAIT